MTTTSPTEDETDAQALQGDSSAFAVLVERHQAALFGYLGRMGLEQGIAEDVAQEAFLRAWLNRDRFDARKAGFRTWFFTIARNLAINEINRRARQNTTTAQADEMAMYQHRMSRTDNHDASVERYALQYALKKLNPGLRDVLALAYVDGLDNAQAAGIAGCSEGAFRTRLHRARSALANALEEGTQ